MSSPATTEKIILTYGTFDLFHSGHLNLLQRLRALGDRLIVGVSTDEFNARKGKTSIIPFEDRLRIVSELRCVDQAIAEHDWSQKLQDIRQYQVSILGMGSDWQGHFDALEAHCQVIYLPRTEGISSTAVRQSLQLLGQRQLADLKQALDLLGSIARHFE